MGRKPPEYKHSAVSTIQSKIDWFNKVQESFDSPYLHFMIYRNGNLHLTFKRADLLERINKMIARSAGNRVPERNKSKRSAKTKVYSKSA
ncbi:methyltransferase [Leptospira kirschneri serovar Mozdok]|nr:methyltransferase [Leptospira kirschneri serovar Mozdok]